MSRYPNPLRNKDQIRGTAIQLVRGNNACKEKYVNQFHVYA
jgi:hypothetical protein